MSNLQYSIVLFLIFNSEISIGQISSVVYRSRDQYDCIKVHCARYLNDINVCVFLISMHKQRFKFCKSLFCGLYCFTCICVEVKPFIYIFFIHDIHTEFGILTGSCLILIGEGINVSFNIHMQKNKNKNKQKAVNILNLYKTYKTKNFSIKG